MKAFWKHQLGTIGAALLIVVVLGAGFFYVGYRVGSENPKTILVQGVSNINDTTKDVDFALFWEAWNLLKNTHLKGEEVSNQDFLYGAIEGITTAIGDPNTNFFRPEDSKKFEEDISGKFGGIGAEIGMREDQVVVVAPLKASPAEKAGLKSGDSIIAVDGHPTAGLTVGDAVKYIRGPIGQAVVLSILREGWSEIKDISIVRDTITVPTLKHEVLDGNISHISIYSFNEIAPREFAEAALAATLNNTNGIILDVRNDPGGYLEVAINIAGWFLNKGDIVVSEKFKSGPDRVFRADGNGLLKNIPVVVLMNQGSASASEILAGALRDQRGTKLVGEHSFGKGTVQELLPLRDGSKLKITIANWLLPNGTIIEENGLKPDIEVTITEADVTAGKDPQLKKAIEVLQAEIENREQPVAITE
ncbi:MAG: S41 family peptidase [Patescibacteria group bacterium]